MTLFEHIDQMARGGSIALLALWSWVLIRDHRGDFPARMAVAMNIAICCYLIATADGYDEPNYAKLIFALGAGATPGLFWLFAKAWFNDEKRLTWTSIILVLMSVLNTLVVQLSFPSGGTINLISGILFRLFMLAFAVASFWELWRGRDGDLIERRRRLRPIMVGATATYVILVAFVEVSAEYALISDWLRQLVGSAAILLVFGFCATMLRMRQAELFGATPTVPKPAASSGAIDDPLIEKLLQFMQAEMPHRDETLSIAKLAAQLGEQEYRLRRTINQAMGHRNFASFLNGYRLSEVKAALADPTQKDVPIITIALDAGFGSLGPFNRAFREAEGMTPSEFRARRLLNPETG
jgi:AraC-like DNA-binding protein